MIYLLQYRRENNAEYLHSNRNYKRTNYNNNINLEMDWIGYKNYKKQCPGLEFHLIPNLISWVGLKPKKFLNYYRLI